MTTLLKCDRCGRTVAESDEDAKKWASTVQGDVAWDCCPSCMTEVRTRVGMPESPRPGHDV